MDLDPYSKCGSLFRRPLNANSTWMRNTVIYIKNIYTVYRITFIKIKHFFNMAKKFGCFSILRTAQTGEHEGHHNVVSLSL